jgi:GNAT superfamily N-acetyltransferase
MPSYSEPRLVCRPSLPADTADVLAFTRRIWDGRDYIHLVWDEWLADPRGILISAQYGADIVGIAKVSPVFPGQWWLHGLRVDPDYQGRKVASRLHDYADAWWLKNGDGVIRLLTSTQRVQVHRLCERTGYARVGEIITYRRSAGSIAQDASAAASRNQFRPASAEELTSALQFARDHLPWIGGLADTGWRFVRPDEDVLGEIISQGHLRWWRDGDGLLATWDGDDDDGPVLGIAFAAVRQPSMLTELLRAAAGLVDLSAVNGMFWLAPTEAPVQSALQQAGFETDQDSGVLFEKPHPGA